MNRTRLTSALLVAGLIATCGVSAIAAEAEAKPSLPPASTKQGVTYAKDIKPLFEASCIRCHGDQRAKARLHLDTLEGVLAGGKMDGNDFKAVIPGDSEKSLIVKAVARIDKETAMPPEPRQRGGRPGGPGGPDQGGPGKAGGQQSEVNSNGDGAHPAPSAENGERPERGQGERGGPGGPDGQGPRGNQGPPPKPLTAEEVGLVRAWIDQGAK